MRKLGIGLLCAGILTFVGQVLGDETLPSMRVGSGQTVIQVTNGQTLQVTTSPTVSALVNLTTVTSSSITGVAVRTSAGTSEGDVTITWVNRGISVHPYLSEGNPEVPFGMEGGEGDKRTGAKGQTGSF